MNSADGPDVADEEPTMAWTPAFATSATEARPDEPAPAVVGADDVAAVEPSPGVDEVEPEPEAAGADPVGDVPVASAPPIDPVAATEPDPEPTAEPEPAESALEDRPVAGREPERGFEPVVVAVGPPADEPGPDATNSGALRPMAPEPVARLRRAAAPSRAQRTAMRLRALVSLLVIIVLAAAGLAAGIGLTAAALSYALKRTLGN